MLARRRQPVALLMLAAACAATGAAPAAAADPGAATILKVRKGQKVALHVAPGGRRIAVLGDRTEFGRRTILSVTGRRGRWAAVATALVRNGRRAWVRLERSRLAVRRTRWRLHADLTDRELTVLRAGRLMRR